MSGVLLAIPALPLLAAAIIRLFDATPRTAARLTVGASAAATIGALALLIAVGVDGPVDAVITDSDGAAIVGVVADRVGAVLVLLTTTVGLIVQTFASRSLVGDPRARRFHVLGAVLGSTTAFVAVAATGSGFVVGWVGTSVALVALLGHKAPWAPALRSQRLAARAFFGGDLSLVIGLVLAIVWVGDIDLRNVGDAAVALDADSVGGLGALTTVALLLVVAGIARSALVPLHAWLPSTLSAPTPVSALLHAGVVNGAGVLLIRFSPVFASSSMAMAFAFAVGLATALFATAIMLVRTDVKGALVWSTSGQMGFMVLQLGVGAFAAALFHIVGHALYKAAMFLGAGGAISAHSRQLHRPHLGRSAAATLTSRALRLTIGGLVPVAALVLALVLVDAHLSAAATVLIVLFGTLSVGRAANGWMSATPLSLAPTIAVAVAGIFAMAFGYVGGIAVFEGFVADVVPYDPPAAVGPVWVVALLSVIATAVLVVAFFPGERGVALRRDVYGWLLSAGTSVIARSDSPAASSDPSSPPRPVLATATQPAAFATAGDPA